MSLENWNQESTKKASLAIELKEKIKVVMPTQVLHQIKYLCKNIPKVEWSGVLFYTIEGSIKQPSKCVLTLQAILPLDMGTAGYTAYALDNRYIDFIEEDFENRCTWKTGHIHSHNTMPVFFSGTDMSELFDNAPNHNFYLSLIVNNYMDFIAKVAIHVKNKTESFPMKYQAQDENGNEYTLVKKQVKIEAKELVTYDCEIFSDVETIEVNSSFSNQVKTIMIPKPKPVEKQYVPFSNVPATVKGKNWSRTEQAKAMQLAQLGGEVEDFIIYLLSDELVENSETIEDCLAYLSYFHLSSEELATNILENYGMAFMTCFEEEDDNGFINITSLVINKLKEYVVEYPFLKGTINSLYSLLNKFKNEHFSTKTKV